MPTSAIPTAKNEVLERLWSMAKSEPPAKRESVEREYSRRTRLEQNATATQDAKQNIERLSHAGSERHKQEAAARLQRIEAERPEIEADGQTFDPATRRDWILRFLENEPELKSQWREVGHRLATLFQERAEDRLSVLPADLRATERLANDITTALGRMGKLRAELGTLGPAALLAELRSLEKCIPALRAIPDGEGPLRTRLAALISDCEKQLAELSDSLQTKSAAELISP